MMQFLLNCVQIPQNSLDTYVYWVILTFPFLLDVFGGSSSRSIAAELKHYETADTAAPCLCNYPGWRRRCS